MFRVPKFLSMEYMNWWQKSLVIAGLIMLAVIVFVIGLFEGYRISLGKC